jgi:hypothetical protein
MNITEVVGKVVAGRYKSPDRPSHVVALEVTAVAAIPTNRGVKPYLFGTRVDADQPGRVVLVRADRFHPSAEVKDAENFKPVEGNWFVGAIGDASFGYVENVTEAFDVKWAEELGYKPLSAFIVSPAKAETPVA